MKSRIRFLLLLCCVALLPFLPQAFTARANQQGDAERAAAGWEHLALRHGIELDKDLSKKINRLGADGWQLVTVSTLEKDGTTVSSTYYFKRAK